MQVQIPELSLVVLIGVSGSGKSTFARRHFGPFEVISSDYCRGLVSNDENDQSATNHAFDLLHAILHKRLELGRLTVVDATNVRPEDRKPLVALARQYHVLPVAIVFNLPERVCHDRNSTRPDRAFGPHVIRSQRLAMQRSLRGLQREGFRHIFTVRTTEEVDASSIVRQPLWNNRKHDHGPFDFIGDVHGCCDELEVLLAKLGYEQVAAPESATTTLAHPEARKAVFVGDLVDRGPRVLDTLKLVMSMVQHGSALCVPGNHDMKLLRKLRGKNVQVTHGLAQTLAELDAVPDGEREALSAQIGEFIDSLVSHYVLDDGKIVVAHAGLKQEMQGRGSGKVREFCLYGETTGETDEFGLPVRYNWASEYRGDAMVVYGHTPVPRAEWLNRTINIDTGCVFGGKLTALRYPERELVEVPALRVYAESVRPFLPKDDDAGLTAQQEMDDVLDLGDVFGKRIISTRLNRNIMIREGQSAAALEVMSRFAVNPKWLIYLPPTMSPCETSHRDGFLEHPDEALSYYRNQGVPRVICQQKHMGSRAVVIVCRDENAVRSRFGIEGDGIGIIYTRTGRRFFQDRAIEAALLDRVRRAADRAGIWNELNTDWLCLDCELMPWSAKAQELLRGQYAAVGSAGTVALAAVVAALENAASRVDDAAPLLVAHRERQAMLSKYVDAYQHYCWPVEAVTDLKLAPFHLLASEGHVHIDRDHAWHMAMAHRLAFDDEPVIMATAHQTVDLTDDTSVAAAVAWWESLTAGGGEGMVVKPMDWVVSGTREFVQPAVKCRGREYLRIIYGPEYTTPDHLQRLRARGLSRKRSLAMREFALGIEALERFVRREPLRRVHECVFGVMAMESEPVDPRL